MAHVFHERYRKDAEQMEKIKRGFASIRFRVMLMLLAVNVVIILLLSAGAYSFYESSYVHEIASSRSDVLSQVSERARQFKTNMYTLSNLYCQSSPLKEYAESLTEENLDEFTQHMDEFTKTMQVAFNQVNIDFYVVYISVDGIGYCSKNVPEAYDYMNPTVKIWYKDIYKANGGIVDVASYNDALLNMNIFSAARTILDSKGNPAGYLMINADERQLYQMYSDIIKSTHSDIYVTNSKGQIVSSSVESLIGFHYFNMDNLEKLFDGKDYMIVSISGHKALFTRHHDDISGFTVFEEIKLAELMQPLMQVRNAIASLALVALGCAAVLAGYFSERLTKPIRNLCKDVKAVENGNLNQPFTVCRYLEINDLSRGMSNMLKQIRELIESVHRKEEQKRRIELNWLQAQIRPHFMYNTLFSIKCLVDMGNNDEASKVLAMFIQMLRSLLSNQDAYVTVAKEMDSLQLYVELMRFRYDDAFDAIVEYDPAAANCYVPKLLVQPLVENAILHGIEIDKHEGIVTVVTRRQGDVLMIEIEDNGVGMSEECIENIMKKKPDEKRVHIGIRNICDRIQLYYGSPWGLEIKSSPGCGTKITIRIPAQETSPE